MSDKEKKELNEQELNVVSGGTGDSDLYDPEVISSMRDRKPGGNSISEKELREAMKHWKLKK